MSQYEFRSRGIVNEDQSARSADAMPSRSEPDSPTVRDTSRWSSSHLRAVAGPCSLDRFQHQSVERSITSAIQRPPSPDNKYWLALNGLLRPQQGRSTPSHLCPGKSPATRCHRGTPRTECRGGGANRDSLPWLGRGSLVWCQSRHCVQAWNAAQTQTLPAKVIRRRQFSNHNTGLVHLTRKKEQSDTKTGLTERVGARLE